MNITADQVNNTKAFALELDRQDELASFHLLFHFPKFEGREVVYFTGNSLGLQPKKTGEYLQLELDDWAKHGVEGHFLAQKPWYAYHEFLTEKMARIIGAKPEETVMMNQLTVNLHLLMVSFYRPQGNRYKILCEAKAFPSDQYAFQSQVSFHGYQPSDAIIEVAPREGQYYIEESDILATIEKYADEIALVIFGGVNYFTGQVFDLKKITAAAHKAGAVAGFDLAHAAGNVSLNLHDWNVDFAAWCSYKYLNSGPGSVAGAFVHERHFADTSLPMFAGWWGHDKASRFNMDDKFVPMKSAERWQLSNAPVLSMAACRASLDIFDEAGMDRLIKKSHKLTHYLQFIIGDVARKRNANLQIITPEKNRGCQLSVVAEGQGKGLHEKLTQSGVLTDWREPNVIRCAPVPLYNSFEDVFRFGEILGKLL
jgi:kynureninase